MDNAVKHLLRTLAFAGMALVLLSPAASWAAEGGESKWGFLMTAGRLFNLALVAAVLVWAARKPLANFFSSRARLIQDQLAEAQAARQEAEARLEEISRRMARLDEELREIRDSAEREAREEYDRILASAELDAGKILERARMEISGMTRSAQIELRAHVADLSVELAERLIRQEINEGDRDRLFGRFVTRLGENR